MLVAPAGYGKTTLAEQWVARDGRCGAWFTARSSATDVAALALGLARSSTSIVADCDVRLREHMRALPAPAENVETLAEILGEDLAEWPVERVARHRRLPRGRTGTASRGLRRRPRVRLSGPVPHRKPRPPVVGLDEGAHVRRRSRAEPGGVGDGQCGGCGCAGRSNSPLSVGPRLPRARLACSHRTRKRLVGRDRGRREQVPESLYRFFADEVFSALGEMSSRG